MSEESDEEEEEDNPEQDESGSEPEDEFFQNEIHQQLRDHTRHGNAFSMNGSPNAAGELVLDTENDSYSMDEDKDIGIANENKFKSMDPKKAKQFNDAHGA